MTTEKNQTRAERNIEWIERLTITIGEDAGKRFRLREWQKAFIRDVYRERTGKRVVRRAILSVARKNGKSELAAALALLHLIGPETELNGEIILAANSRDQAAVVFNAVKRMVEADPNLAALIELVPSTKRAFVKRSDLRSAGSVLRAVAADAGTLHGLNPSLVIYDELAQAKSRELFDTLTTSQGARAAPLFLTISTQNNDAQHVLSEMIDDGLTETDEATVCHLYAAEDDCDLMDESQWFAANPALGDFRSLDELRSMAARAVRLPSEEQAFRLLYLNQRVSLDATFVAAADWRACADKDVQFEDGEDVILALDMSSVADLTSLTAISCASLDETRVAQWFWKPSDHIEQHTKTDRFRYDVQAKNGNLLLCPGRTIKPMMVAAKIGELSRRYNVRALVYDRWRIEELLNYLEMAGILASEEGGAGLRVVNFGQGLASMAPALDAFERALLDGSIKHPDHPILNFCMMNAIATSDPAGNRKLNKAKSTRRIDGAVTLVMAIGYKAKMMADEPQFTNPYDDDDSFSLLSL